MAKEKIKFCLIMDGSAMDDPEKFQKSMTAAYVNGIEPKEAWKDTILDENNNVVSTVILVECQERWSGAAKRFFRKAKFEYLDQKYHGLPVFG